MSVKNSPVLIGPGGGVFGQDTRLRYQDFKK